MTPPPLAEDFDFQDQLIEMEALKHLTGATAILGRANRQKAQAVLRPESITTPANCQRHLSSLLGTAGQEEKGAVAVDVVTQARTVFEGRGEKTLFQFFPQFKLGASSWEGQR